jgi:hypothetical protein
MKEWIRKMTVRTMKKKIERYSLLCADILYHLAVCCLVQRKLTCQASLRTIVRFGRETARCALHKREVMGIQVR